MVCTLVGFFFSDWTILFLVVVAAGSAEGKARPQIQ